MTSQTFTFKGYHTSIGHIATFHVNLLLFVLCFLSLFPVPLPAQLLKHTFVPVEDYVEINEKQVANGYGEGIRASDIVFFDEDRDGDLDIFGGLGNQIVYYRNDCEGDTIKWTLVTTNYGGIHMPFAAVSPFFIDVTGDGLEDLFIGCGPNANKGGNVVYYQNVGSYTQAAWQLVDTMVAGIDVGDRSVPRLADPDWDGDMDLIVGGGFGDLVYHENIGTSSNPIWDSTSTAFANISTGWRVAPFLLDIDQDMNMDLFFTEAYGSFQHYEDAHPHPDTIDWQLVSDDYLSRDLCPAMGGCVLRPVFVDIDNDGDQDIFVSGPGLKFFENTGTSQAPQWNYSWPNYPVLSVFARPYLVDLNGDHVRDLIAPLRGSHVDVFLNTGTPQQAAWQFIPDTLDEFDQLWTRDWAFFDLDGDADQDCIVSVNSPNEMRVYRNIGDSIHPHFQYEPDPFWSLSFSPTSNSFIEVLDLENDPDTVHLLFSDQSNMYHVSNQGTGTQPAWQIESSFYLPFPPGQVNYGAGTVEFDFDEEGKSDGDLDMIMGKGIYVNHGTNSSPQWIFECVQWKFEGLSAFNPQPSNLVDFLPNSGPESWVDGQLFTYAGIQPEITTNPVSICSSEAFLFEAIPSGGVWSGAVDSSGSFPKDMAAGSYVAIYAYTHSFTGNTLSDTVHFSVRQGPAPTDFTANAVLINNILELCSDDSIQQMQSAIISSGVWGGIASSFGEVDPAAWPSGLHWVTYSRFENACQRIDSIPVNIKSCPPTSIYQEGDQTFLVYPNPSSGQLYVELDVSVGTLLLYNIQGKIVRRQEIYTSREQIYTADLIPGLYVLHIHNEKGKLLASAKVQIN